MSRLIWQFELTDQPWISQGSWYKDAHKWEVRYFWPYEQIIKLNLHESQLHWNEGVCKTHHDIYLVDKDNPLNIKRRQDKLVYKPLINQTNNRIAYDKKITLSEDKISEYNLITVPIEKIAIQLTLHEKPKCVLELSRIQLLNQTYSSLCLESRCGELLDSLHAHLQLPGQSSSYVNFIGEKLIVGTP